MDDRGKKRLVGAAIVVSLFVIFTPMVLDRTRVDPVKDRAGTIPPMPTDSYPSQLLRLDQPPPLLTEAPPAETDDGVPFEEPPAEAPPLPPDPGPAQPPQPAPLPATAARPAPSTAGVAPPPQPPRPSQPTVPAPPRGAAVPEGEAKPPPASDERSPAVAEGEPAIEAKPANARVGLSAWAVQLSTFANAANAISLRDALRGRGFVAFVESTPEKTTRVYLGPDLQKQNAVAAQQRLARELGIKGAVVPYPAGGTP